MALLVTKTGQWCSYRAIYDCVHYAGFMAGQGGTGYLTNVRSIMKRMRRKFRTLDPEFDEIINQAATGYAWRAGAIGDSPASDQQAEPA